MSRKTDPPRKHAEGQADSSAEPAQANIKRGRLTPFQQSLAVRYLPMARALAKPLKLSWPAESHEFESAACLALVEASQSYDPERNVKFATYARYRIWGALRDVQRGLVTAGWRSDMENAPGFISLVPTAEEFGEVMMTEPDPPVGQELEVAEVLENWLRKLPARHAETCRELYFNQKTQNDTAESLGISKSRISYIHQEALQILNDIWKYSRLDPEDLLKG